MTTVDRDAAGRAYADGEFGAIFWDGSNWVVPSRSVPELNHFVAPDLQACTCWDSYKGELCSHARGVARHIVRQTQTRSAGKVRAA